MTREQKRPEIRNVRRACRAADEREIGVAYWGAAAILLVYLTAVCALRGYSFAFVAIGAAAIGLGALVSAVAMRLYD